MLELLLTLAIAGLVYFHAVRTNYRSTFENTMYPRHIVHSDQPQGTADAGEKN